MYKSSHKIKKGLLTAIFAVSKQQEPLIPLEKEEAKVINMVHETLKLKINTDFMAPVSHEPFLAQYRRIGGFPADERW